MPAAYFKWPDKI